MSVNRIRKNSGSLLKLVSILSKTEKAYCTKYLNRFKTKESNNGGKLFDLLQKKPDSTNTQLSVKLNINERNLTNLKIYLYNQLIEALQHFHQKDSIKSKILSDLGKIDLLHKKSIFNDALKETLRLKNYCEIHQMHSFIPQVLHWEIILLQYTSDNEAKFVDQKIELQNQYLESIKLQENLMHLHILKSKFQKINQLGIQGNIDIEKELKSLLSNELLSNPQKALSPQAKLHRFQLLYLINKKIDPKAAVKNCYDLIETLEIELGFEYIKHNLSIYIDAYSNLAASSSSINDEKGFEVAIQKLDEVETNFNNKITEQRQFNLFRNKYILISDRFDLVNYTDKLIDDIPIIEKGLKKYTSKLRPSITSFIYQGIANAYYFKGDYKKAIKWYGRIEEFNKTDLSKRLFINSKILNLIMYFETDYLHINSIIKNTKYALNNMIADDSIETLILKTIDKLNRPRIKANEVKEIKERLLNQITNHPGFTLSDRQYTWWLRQKENS